VGLGLADRLFIRAPAPPDTLVSNGQNVNFDARVDQSGRIENLQMAGGDGQR